MNSLIRILLLEDDANDVELIQSILIEEGFVCDVHQVETRSQFLHALENSKFDLILSDKSLPSFDGISALTIAQEKQPDIPFIFVSGTLGEELAIESLKSGATDYVIKQRMSRLVPAVRRALNETEEKMRRKQSEEALAKNAAELARSNAELEQFAYSASHDLQEPIRMVISYVQLLEKRYKDKLDSDANEFIAFAVEGATRMKRLIDNMLSFSRLGAKQEPAARTVNCNTVLNEVLENLKFTIKENDATITHDPLPTITGDATHLTQLFQNLIRNSLKFRSKRRPNIHIGVKKQKNEWLFSVKDNGIGLEPEYRKRIFQMFQRLHDRSEYSGTGIGLAICQKIITQNGGRIWVESKPGKGSTFYFTIPDKAKIK